MSSPEKRLHEMGLELPAPMSAPPGVHLPFAFVNVRGDRVLFSGSPRCGLDGKVDGPFGVLGQDMTTEEGQAAARGIALTVFAGLKAEIGDLSRIAGWVRVFGMVTSAPGYSEQHLVINGFSDLVIAAFGDEVGRHARSAIGVASLPLGFAMEIEGEVLLA